MQFPSVDPNPIRAAVRKYLANLQATGTPAAADDSAVRGRVPAPVTRDPGMTVRAQPRVAHVSAHGLLGVLNGLGESVDQGIHERLQTGPKVSDALFALPLILPELGTLGKAAPAAQDAELAARDFYSTLPGMVQRGEVMPPAVRDKAIGSLMTALPNGGVATGGATAAAAANAGGMTEAQLQEWRNIVKALGDENAAPPKATPPYSPRPAAPDDPYAGVRPAAEDMAIPANLAQQGRGPTAGQVLRGFDVEYPDDPARTRLLQQEDQQRVLTERFRNILNATTEAGKYKPTPAEAAAAEMARRGYGLLSP